MSEAVAEAPAKSGSKVWIIMLAGLLVAVLAGGGVYILTGKDHSATTEEAARGGKKTKAAAPKLPVVYVKLDPPFVANFEARGAMRFLQVSVEVMTHDPATAELLKTHDPMIRNDLLMLFGSQTYEGISTHEGKDQLRTAALEAVRKIVTSEGGDAEQVEQLYFTSFVMQ